MKLGFFNAQDLVVVASGLALVFICAVWLEREIVRYLVVRTVEEQRLTFRASLNRFSAGLMAIGSPKPEVPQPLSVTSHDGV